MSLAVIIGDWYFCWIIYTNNPDRYTFIKKKSPPCSIDFLRKCSANNLVTNLFSILRSQSNYRKLFCMQMWIYIANVHYGNDLLKASTFRGKLEYYWSRGVSNHEFLPCLELSLKFQITYQHRFKASLCKWNVTFLKIDNIHLFTFIIYIPID